MASEAALRASRGSVGPGWAHRNDGDAGPLQVGARYYDAQVGRFITRDTALSQAAYRYCGGDPVNAVDPDGHTPGMIVWLAEIIRRVVGGPATPPGPPVPRSVRVDPNAVFDIGGGLAGGGGIAAKIPGGQAVAVDLTAIGGGIFVVGLITKYISHGRLPVPPIL